MSVSLSIDSIINLIRSGRVAKREKIIGYLKLLEEKTDELAKIWIGVTDHARKYPESTWAAVDVDQYFERIDPGNSIQKYCHTSTRQLYNSLSVAMAGRLNEDSLLGISQMMGSVLEARMWLRGWYVYDFLPHKSLRTVPTPEEIEDMEKFINILLERTAKLHAAIAVLEANL